MGSVDGALAGGRPAPGGVTMGDLAHQYQIHVVQPVLPVPDVAAAADWFVRVLGFDVDFL